MNELNVKNFVFFNGIPRQTLNNKNDGLFFFVYGTANVMTKPAPTKTKRKNKKKRLLFSFYFFLMQICFYRL
jgi:hypothetical protein